MNIETIQKKAPNHLRRGSRAILYLGGQPTGIVLVKGGDASWGFGEFHPDENFSTYAPLFGFWSLLMHADDSGETLSREAARELSQAESQLDSIKTRLFFPQSQEWINVAQLTIDGDLLEWKEY